MNEGRRGEGKEQDEGGGEGGRREGNKMKGGGKGGRREGKGNKMEGGRGGREKGREQNEGGGREIIKPHVNHKQRERGNTNYLHHSAKGDIVATATALI